MSEVNLCEVAAALEDPETGPLLMALMRGREPAQRLKAFLDAWQALSAPAEKPRRGRKPRTTAAYTIDEQAKMDTRLIPPELSDATPMPRRRGRPPKVRPEAATVSEAATGS